MLKQVIRAQSQDAEIISPLFDEYRQFYGYPGEPELALSFISQRLKRDESVIFYLPDEQNQALGFVQLYPGFSSLQAAPLLILNDIYVTQHARCVGIGRALLDAALNYAKAQDINELILETQRNNVRAQALYESIGFVRDNEFFHYSLTLKP